MVSFPFFSLPFLVSGISKINIIASLRQYLHTKGKKRCRFARLPIARAIRKELATTASKFSTERMVMDQPKSYSLQVARLWYSVSLFGFCYFLIGCFSIVDGFFAWSNDGSGLAGTHDSWGPQIKGLTGSDRPNDDDKMRTVDQNSGAVGDSEMDGEIEVCAFDNRGMGSSSVPTQKSYYTWVLLFAEWMWSFLCWSIQYICIFFSFGSLNEFSFSVSFHCPFLGCLTEFALDFFNLLVLHFCFVCLLGKCRKNRYFVKFNIVLPSVYLYFFSS